MEEWVPRSIGNMLEEAARLNPDGEFIVIGSDRFTYSRFKQKVDQLARGFLTIGIQPRDKVGLWLPNVLPWVLSMFALVKIGAVIVPINTRFKAAELDYVLNQSDSTALIFPDEFLNIKYVNIVHQVLPELVNATSKEIRSQQFPLLKSIICVSHRDYPGMHKFKDLFNSEKKINLESVGDSVRPDDTALILYTSGSTGFPKGVMLTHTNILRDGYEIGKRLGLRRADRYLNPCPFYHNAGLVNGILSTLTHFCCLFSTPHFDPEECLRIIQKERCTAILGIQTMFIKMFESETFEKTDFSSLRTGLTTGTAQTVSDIYKKMGVKNITNVYGISEASPACSMSDCERDPIDIRIAKMGRPFPGVEMKIVDPQKGEKLKANEKGEICVRGWNVMQGYYKNPEETKKAIDPEGWLHTGDLGSIDENGYVYFAGRIKNIIRVGGENISPEEVENFIYKYPKVKQVEIVGIPDERYGEKLVAFIELKQGGEAKEQEIIEWMKNKIANFKIPRNVRFIKSWPMTGSGKVQKFKLREMYLKEESENKKRNDGNIR